MRYMLRICYRLPLGAFCLNFNLFLVTTFNKHKIAPFLLSKTKLYFLLLGVGSCIDQRPYVSYIRVMILVTVINE